MLIILFPLLGLLPGFFTKYIGKVFACYSIIGINGMAWLTTIYLWLITEMGQTIIVYKFKWFLLNDHIIHFGFIFDPLSLTMCFLITTITTLVMCYSYGYLNEDPYLIKFLSLLSFFALSMLLLVTAQNFIQLFLGWEFVGLVSFLLISFWNTRNDANQSAIKAIIVNRIGDLFFMFALGLMWVGFYSFDFNIVAHNYTILFENWQISATYLNADNMLALSLPICLLVAAFAKSAQLFWHTWLPDAMEGPTPVSSLLHSATMVTAGVFLILRSSYIFAITPFFNYILIFIGLSTALLAGIINFSQMDLKKIVAYSTCSQLGYMVFICGLGYYNYVIFHLVTHAFFKCLLFLCSGSIIHAANNEQDIRKMGRYYKHLPLTTTMMIIGNAALCGIPGLAGYYSKDLLLETALSSGKFGIVIFALASFGAFLTASYSVKSLYFAFYSDEPQNNRVNRQTIHEAPLFMLIPMIILTIFAIFSGYCFKEIFTGPTSVLFWNSTLADMPMNTLTEFEYDSFWIKTIPTICSISGGLITLFIFRTTYYYKISLSFFSIVILTKQKFYFDHIYNLMLALPTVILGYAQYRIIDRGFLEYFGATGIVTTGKLLAKYLYVFLSGYVRNQMIVNAFGINIVFMLVFIMN